MTSLLYFGFCDDDGGDDKIASKFKKIFKTNNETKNVGQVIKSRNMEWKCAKFVNGVKCSFNNALTRPSLKSPPTLRSSRRVMSKSVYKLAPLVLDMQNGIHIYFLLAES